MAQRPSGVPEGAWWSEKDDEWILGDRDDAGRLVGEVRYWRPDGTLVSTCPHSQGKPHGLARRFHESGEVSQTAHYEDGVMHGTRTWHASDNPTTEKMHHGQMSRKIVRAEVDYDHGTAAAFRYFDRDGRPVRLDGTPLPDRPAGVPAGAIADGSDWIDGRWTDSGDPTGTLRRYDRRGRLTAEEHHADGKIAVTTYYSNGQPRLRYTLQSWRLIDAAEARDDSGTVRRRASFTDDGHTTEDFDRTGASVRRSEFRRAINITTDSPDPPPADARVLAAIDEGDDLTLAATAELTPVALACAIARGWGGDDERDADAARRARKLVRRIVPPSLSEKFAALGLDRAPRLITAARLDTIARELAADPAIDGDTLINSFIDGGGTGIALALRTPARAEALLRSRITKRHLDLTHLGLDALPPAIAALPELHSIDAGSNRLRDLPPELADLFLLQKLDLSRNTITRLPPELAHLPDLRTLYLANNRLRSLPPAVFALEHIQSLGLGDNELTEIPDALGDLGELHSLWLNDNLLKDLPRSLTRLRKLRFLHLGDHSWPEPPAVLGELESLEELWIASRSLQRLPESICRLPNLRRLHVWYSNLKEVPDVLFSRTDLLELRIKNNPLPDGTIERLQAALPGCSIY